MKKITVKIKDGKSEVMTEGYKGASCQDATKALEKTLGSTVSDVPTNEMYEQETEEYLEEGQW